MEDDTRQAGRLPKYNPARKDSFKLSDWKHVCQLVLEFLTNHSLHDSCAALQQAISLDSPRKSDQDKLDAYLCLLSGIHLTEQNECLMVGDFDSGYMVVPYNSSLHHELNKRCQDTNRSVANFVNTFSLEHSSLGKGAIT